MEYCYCVSTDRTNLLHIFFPKETMIATAPIVGFTLISLPNTYVKMFQNKNLQAELER